MPLIKTQVSKDLSSEKKEELVKKLSAKCAEVLGKPESFVVSIVDDNSTITFGGEIREFAYIELKSIGALGPVVNEELTIAICDVVNDIIDIEGDKVYIEFSDVPGAYWGWNNKTFR